MNKKFQNVLFVFRRDLRLEDNTGLIFALENANEVIPCFIFTPEQIENNSYSSARCLQFMIESLEELEKSIVKKGGKLYLFYGQPEQIIAEVIEKLKVEAVILNRDYTPYSIQRDKKIEITCHKSNILFHSFDDALLNPPESTLKADGRPYSIFTPYFRNASKQKIDKPKTNLHSNYYSIPISFSKHKLYEKILPQMLIQASGGRSAALKILYNLDDFSDYNKFRDFPAADHTTHLSAHLKFTTCSVREVYWAISNQLGSTSELFRALYWRDFFYCISYYFPHVFSGAFHSKMDRLEWNNNKPLFEKWCEGKTGFPIVDAGMREMNETGFMHNRVRMIVASFLVKNLHIDWRWGEKYFAQKLIDYDPAVNNGNWQWCASTGCDAQPYFRIFNPWTQAKKFDPDAIYIKRWVPELGLIPSDVIHNWYMEKYRLENPSYPKPIVDHSKEAKITLEYYKKLSKKS